MKYERSLMKENAKAAMALANPKTWLVTLAFLILMGVIPGVVSALVPNPLGEYIGALVGAAVESGSLESVPPEDLFLGMVGVLGVSLVLSLGASVAIAIFRALMTYGYQGYALEVYRRDPGAGAGSLFKGFQRLGPVVGSAILVGLFSFLWGLLIYGAVAFITVLIIVLCEDLSAGSWAGLVALFFAAGLLHSIIVYRYCLAPYYVMSRDGMNGSAAVTASVGTMRGNVFKRFVLELSFLGWKILLKLIVLGLFLCGCVVALFISGGSLLSLIDLVERAKYMDPEAAGPFVVALLGVALPFLAVAAVTFLAQVPLNLWLTSYRNVAYAGFFQELTGGMAQTSPVTPCRSYASSGFNNAQPPAPGASSLPEAVPVTAPYTPFGGQAEVVPQAPAVPTVPAAPQAPAAPVPFTPEEPQAPAAPADPEPEGPQAPVIPEDPEN